MQNLCRKTLDKFGKIDHITRTTVRIICMVCVLQITSVRMRTVCIRRDRPSIWPVECVPSIESSFCFLPTLYLPVLGPVSKRNTKNILVPGYQASGISYYTYIHTRYIPSDWIRLWKVEKRNHPEGIPISGWGNIRLHNNRFLTKQVGKFDYLIEFDINKQK